MKLKNRIALVTGASSGIGRAVALEFAKEGAFILLTARNIDELNKTKKLINDLKFQAEIIPADLDNTKSINELVKNIKRKTKKLDIIANIAGIWHGKNEVYAGKNFEKFDQEIVLQTMFVGLISHMMLVHSLVSLMSENSKIVNLSSTFESGAKGWLPYYVSKRGIEDLTIGLAEELKEKNIQVNGISPSDTATEAYKKYFPQYINEAIEPEKIAEFATYLASEKTNDVTGKVYVLKKDSKPFEAFHY